MSLPPSFPTPVLPPVPAGFCVLSSSGPLPTKEICRMVSEMLLEGPAMCWSWDRQAYLALAVPWALSPFVCVNALACASPHRE